MKKKKKTEKELDRDALDEFIFLHGFNPEELRIPAVCLVAVQQNGNAVKQNSKAIEYVPKSLMTMKLCMAAVQIDGLTLKYVPEKQKTLTLCHTAVKQNGFALRYAPKKIKEQPELREIYVQCHIQMALEDLDKDFEPFDLFTFKELTRGINL